MSERRPAAGAGATNVAVVGSINTDLVCEVDTLPSPGETVLARRTRHNVGGKGSNQAVAAALAGAAVEFVGRIGDDRAGADLRAALARRGVGVRSLRIVPEADSGVAYILLADDNIITVDPGANSRWDAAADITTDRATIESAAVVVAQLEIPMSVVHYASQHCSGRFVLNAAPPAALPDQVLRACDPLVLNEHEISRLTESSVDDVATAREAAGELLRSGARSVVVTLGAAGAVWSDGTGEGHVPAPAVPVVDTTGAGDAFVGNLAAELAQGSDLARSVDRAVLAASISVGHPGTHDSYPDAAALAASALTASKGQD